MRVLYVIPGLYRVGDYHRCVGFAEALAARGHAVTLLVGERKVRPWFTHVERNGVRIVTVPYWGELRAAEWICNAQPDTKLPLDILFRAAWVALNAHDFSVVHVFHIGLSSLTPFLVSRRAAPNTVCIQDWCDMWGGGILLPSKGVVGRLDHWLSCAVERWSICTATAVTVNSTYLASVASQNPTRHILKIIEGADLELVRPESKEACRHSLGIARNVRWLGFAAFFNPDSELLVETLKQMARIPHPQFQVMWIGPVDRRLEQSLVAAGLRGLVTSVGVVSRERISVYLGACDVLMLPFSTRPVNLARWPAKFGDYLAAGRPIVTNPTGEVATFFQRHSTIGVLVDAVPDAFARATCELIGNDEALEGKGHAARRAAEADLSWSGAAERMESFYQDLVANYRSEQGLG